MTQGYTQNSPAQDANAISQIERDNFEALLTNHAGAALPAYAEEGLTFFDTVSQQLHVAKLYGSKAYADYAMGAVVKLFISLIGAGQDGSLYDVDVRLQDETLLGLAPNLWELSEFSPVGGALSVYFSKNFPPSYFAGRIWDDPVLGEPVLWTSDGVLRNKTWETIPEGLNEVVYSGSPSPLSNIIPFVNTTLRAVTLEDREIRLNLPTSFSGKDHVLMALPVDWWEVQDDKLEFDLFVNGSKRSSNRFKAVPFLVGGSPYVVLYLLTGVTEQLEQFVDGRDYELNVRKVL